MKKDNDTERSAVPLTVTDRVGRKHSVSAQIGEPLMYALRDSDLGIEATCDGGGICATCHVYLTEDWHPCTTPADVFEQMQLDGLINVKSGSRLACQINVTAALTGKCLTIAPIEL